jgi:hypothetical protein
MNIGTQALIVIGTAGTNGAGARIAELALAHHLPACYPFRDTVAAGGLVSFSPHFDAIARRGADYVSKIVKGAKPSELPVEQLRDTRFTSILRPRRRSRSKCRRQCSPAPTRLSSRSASIHVQCGTSSRQKLALFLRGGRGSDASAIWRISTLPVPYDGLCLSTRASPCRRGPSQWATVFPRRP